MLGFYLIVWAYDSLIQLFISCPCLRHILLASVVCSSHEQQIPNLCCCFLKPVICDIIPKPGTVKESNTVNGTGTCLSVSSLQFKLLSIVKRLISYFLPPIWTQIQTVKGSSSHFPVLMRKRKHKQKRDEEKKVSTNSCLPKQWNIVSLNQLKMLFTISHYFLGAGYQFKFVSQF